jgi:RNA polymerase sigma factor (sigma-70 family)
VGRKGGLSVLLPDDLGTSKLDHPMDENQKFARLGRNLLPYFRWLTKGTGLAEDFLQAAFAKCWEEWPEKPEEEFRRLMMMVGQQLYCSWLRRSRHGRACSIQEDAIAGDTEDFLEKEELLERVRQALGRLSPLQQEVLRLVYLEHGTYQEAARVMRQPLSTVKRWGRKARVRLRAILSSYFRN